MNVGIRMKRYTTLPDGYPDWHTYLRKPVFTTCKDWDTHILLRDNYHEHLAMQARDIKLPDENILTVNYRFPSVVRGRDGMKRYGSFGFYFYDKLTGAKRQVPFHHFARHGFNKDTGQSEGKIQIAVYCFWKSRETLDEIKHNARIQFWAKARRLYEKWEPYMPRTICGLPSKSERHQLYYGSREWEEKANAIKERDQYHCQCCGLHSRVLHAHHRTYAREGKEALDDLRAVCPSCHKELHANKCINIWTPVE